MILVVFLHSVLTSVLLNPNEHSLLPVSGATSAAAAQPGAGARARGVN